MWTAAPTFNRMAVEKLIRTWICCFWASSPSIAHVRACQNKGIERRSPPAFGVIIAEDDAFVGRDYEPPVPHRDADARAEFFHGLRRIYRDAKRTIFVTTPLRLVSISEP